MILPPSSFTIFGKEIMFYGVIMAIAILVAILVANKLLKYRDLKKGSVIDCAFLAIPLGIIGARFLHVILNLQDYSFYEAIAFWEGWQGLSIYGAIIFGAIGVAIVCKIKKINFLRLADVVAVGIILAQCIGRWGNFFNQELYGPIVNFNFFPFSVFIESTGNFHAAMFFYESFVSLIGFFVLLVVLKKCKTAGTVLGSYLIFYGTVRFIMEPFRVDTFKISFFRPYQLISVAVVLIGIGILIYLNVKKKRENKNALEK